MGYRSDVYMCIRGPLKKMLTEVALLRLEGDKCMQDALDEWSLTAVELGRAVLVLGGNGTDWKWYEDFPDVQAHLAVFQHFQTLAEDDDESNFGGNFSRIGEETDDVVQDYFGDGDELACIVRTIDRSYTGSGVDLRPRIEEARQKAIEQYNLEARKRHNQTS